MYFNHLCNTDDTHTHIRQITIKSQFSTKMYCRDDFSSCERRGKVLHLRYMTYVRFPSFGAKQKTSGFFCDTMQLIGVISYRRFGTTSRLYLQGSKNPKYMYKQQNTLIWFNNLSSFCLNDLPFNFQDYINITKYHWYKVLIKAECGMERRAFRCLETF